jgi:carbamoyltransferase
MSDAYNILGVNHGGHDTSSALMQDGQLVAACEQERYTLDKHSRRFPIDAIDDCLSRAGIGIGDVDELAYAFQPLYHIREAYLRPALTDAKRVGALLADIDRIRENFSIETLIREQTGFSGQINYYHHHECHLASAWYPSGFNRALVVSYDGIGEIETGLLAVGDCASLDVFHKGSRYPDSLGLLYSAVTHYLGWRHHCDEGIIMGLACYGDPNAKTPGDDRSYIEIFREIVREIGDYDYEIGRDWIAYHEIRDKWVGGHFTAVFGEKRNSSDSLTSHHKNIAAALQLRVEEVVLAQLRRAQEQYQVDRLCLSGGVALNCSMNGKIEQSGIFDEIFVQPASGDAGVAVGACYLAQKTQEPDLKPAKTHNFFLGSVFDDQEIAEAFAGRDIEATQPDDLFQRVAERLAEGRIIGWFQGGAEFGPRALGNRSILTRPFPAEMKDYLNARVKFREEFRPFAPAVLASHFSEYFDIDQESPHMLIACQATEKARQEIPATVHIDDSCRVQTVRKELSPRFYSLLEAFFKQTECPVLLNTSFNVRGQPIVNTPGQAIDCYLGTNIDCLVVGDFFIEKETL